MALSDEPKMAELKRLLRRLDGLDASRSAGKAAAPSDDEQHDYVGALRGAPELEEGAAPVAVLSPAKVSASSAALIAGAAAALVSTATVYVFMSTRGGPAVPDARQTPAATRLLPSRLDAPAPGNGTLPATTTPEDVTNELIRSASQLLDTGNIEAARELLRRAAERGSGPAALTLARSYEAHQVQAGVPAANETNSVLARVWYERAQALGVAQAEIQASSPDPRR